MLEEEDLSEEDDLSDEDEILLDDDDILLEEDDTLLEEDEILLDDDDILLEEDSTLEEDFDALFEEEDDLSEAEESCGGCLKIESSRSKTIPPVLSSCEIVKYGEILRTLRRYCMMGLMVSGPAISFASRYLRFLKSAIISRSR